MGKVTAIGTFSRQNSEAAAGDFRLEQKPWPKKDPAKFADWLAAQSISPSGGNLIAAWEQYKSQCDDSGDLCPTLRVRLADLSTPYVLRASYGSLSSATMVVETRREYLAFELDTEKAVDFGEITAWSWNGPVYNEAGNIVTNPTATTSGRLAKTGIPVYGVMEVEVREELWEHLLTISPRTPTPAQAEGEGASLDELYAATAMLFCDGKIQLLEIEMPADSGSCDAGFGGTETGVSDGEPSEEQPTSYAVTFETFNYCTGVPIRDARITLNYRDAEGKERTVTVAAGDTVRLPGGSYRLRATASGYTPSDEDDLSENDRFSLARPETQES